MVNFEPTPEQQRFIEAKLDSGRYRDAGEVLREGLRLWMEIEESEGGRRASWREDARRRIEEGWQDAQRGELLDSEEVFDELRRAIDAAPDRRPETG
jgi:antitoxin ParD1/3/4